MMKLGRPACARIPGLARPSEHARHGRCASSPVRGGSSVASLAQRALLGLLLAFLAPLATAQGVPTLKVELPDTITEGEVLTAKFTLSAAATHQVDFRADIHGGRCGYGLFHDNCPAGTTAARSGDTPGYLHNIAFAPGDRVKTVTWAMPDDAAIEGVEVFNVVIEELHSSEATIDPSTPHDRTDSRGSFYWYVRIKDNDPAVVSLARVGTGAVAEGGKVTFTVSLGRSLAAGEAVSVPLLVGGAGLAPADWRLSLKAGEGLNKGVSLSREGTFAPKVVFAGHRTDQVRVATLELATAAEGGETFGVELGRKADFDAEADTNVDGGAELHGTRYGFSVRVRNDGRGGTLNPPPPTPPPPPPPSVGGGGGGGGSSNRPPVVEAAIADQSLKVGESLEVRLRSPVFHDDDLDFLNFEAASSDGSVVQAEADDLERSLALRGMGRGRAEVSVTASDRRHDPVGQTFKVTVIGPALIPYLPRASDPFLQGFLRIANRSGKDAEIAVAGTDDEGVDAGPVTLGLGAGRTVHLNSGDLEEGNAAKGLPDGLGPPATGDWRLLLKSEADFDVYAYVRAGDGFVTPVNGSAPARDGALRIAAFNPASNWRQVSRLRLVNPGDDDAEVTVTGTDDAGEAGDAPVELTVAAGKSRTLSATDLETGSGVEGALGDGAGKWRLAVESDAPIAAVGLLSSPGGHLSNLSMGPIMREADGRWVVPHLPSASDPQGRQGFVRILNRSGRDGETRIAATDDSGRAAPPLTLSIGAGRTVHLNSGDIELGNAGKGLTGSAGAGYEDWRLELASALDLDVLAYVRTADGFLAAMHDLAPAAGQAHRVATFNPGSNGRQVSLLRLVNPGDADAAVTVTGVDDAGAAGDAPVTLTVLAGRAVTLAAVELEHGGGGLSGALGDGAGKWRLLVEADEPIIVMNLLSSPTGHLSNLSAAPGLDPPGQ